MWEACTSGDLLECIDVWDKARPVFQARDEHLMQQLWLRPLLEGVLTHVHQNHTLFVASFEDVCAEHYSFADVPGSVYCKPGQLD